jgi:hypothetical protein
MTKESLEARREQITDRLRNIRKSYGECVSDVTTDIASRGSEWSIVDLLKHVTGSYRGMLTRLLEEDNPDLGGAYDPEAAWKRVIDTVMRDIEGTISTASDLTIEQLGRSGQRSGESIGVLDVLTLMADHYDEHLVQLKNEIRLREDLP